MHRMFKTPKIIDELASMFDSTKQLIVWMRLHIRNIEREDTILRPQSVLNNGEGSNLEFVWLLHEILKLMDIESYIITVNGNSKSSVCVIEDKGKEFKCVVNRWTTLKRYKRIDDVPDSIDSGWGVWIEWVSMKGRLVPIKPHYRNDDYDKKKDTRSYLLCDRLSSV